MKIKIIFEDGEILVIDKPTGLVVNRAQTVREETLQDQLSDYFKLNDLGIGDRAGIVHRLDRETSGLLIIAKGEKAYEFLQSQFRERLVKKEYLALCHGHLKEKSGSITSRLGRVGKFGKFGNVKEGRESQTNFEVKNLFSFNEEKLRGLLNGGEKTKARIRYLKQQANNYSLVILYPQTGRTHQIRVHIKSLGNPVVSDLIYTPKKLVRFDLSWCPRLFLHSSLIEFRHPKTKKAVSFSSPLPKDLKDAILNLKLIE